MSKDTELPYYELFMKLCKRNTEVELAYVSGHINWRERQNLATRKCQEVWNKNKDELIPKLKKFKSKKVSDKNQTSLDMFTDKEEYILSDEEIRLFEYFLDHDEEK